MTAAQPKGTVTHPKGFRAAGVKAGLKQSGARDLALVVNDGPLDIASAVFTSNRAKANPVLWSMEAIREGSTRAIVLNSGGANCFTGEFGFETSELTAKRVAELLGASPSQVQVCSTGLIGEGGEEFRRDLLAGLPLAVQELSGAGGGDAAEAILTTDSHAKTAVFEGPGWSIAGMAKGAGMLAPGMATMLCVLTTDAVVSQEDADAALEFAVGATLNRLDSDGCMSTNDQTTLLVSGASGIAVPRDEFERALCGVCLDLALQLQGDAEGSSHDIAIEVKGAATEADAVEVGRSIARNNLFKAAVFGNDPNWGRILAAVGTTSATFDPYDIDVWINGVRVCSKGGPDQPRSAVDMQPRQVDVVVNLRAGDESATIWTNDLTHDYVHENSAYSS